MYFCASARESAGRMAACGFAAGASVSGLAAAAESVEFLASSLFSLLLAFAAPSEFWAASAGLLEAASLAGGAASEGLAAGAGLVFEFGCVSPESGEGGADCEAG